MSVNENRNRLLAIFTRDSAQGVIYLRPIQLIELVKTIGKKLNYNRNSLNTFNKYTNIMMTLRKFENVKAEYNDKLLNFMLYLEKRAGLKIEDTDYILANILILYEHIINKETLEKHGAAEEVQIVINLTQETKKQTEATNQEMDTLLSDQQNKITELESEMKRVEALLNNKALSINELERKVNELEIKVKQTEDRIEREQEKGTKQQDKLQEILAEKRKKEDQRVAEVSQRNDIIKQQQQLLSNIQAKMIDYETIKSNYLAKKFSLNAVKKRIIGFMKSQTSLKGKSLENIIVQDVEAAFKDIQLYDQKTRKMRKLLLQIITTINTPNTSINIIEMIKNWEISNNSIVNDTFVVFDTLYAYFQFGTVNPKERKALESFVGSLERENGNFTYSFRLSYISKILRLIKDKFDSLHSVFDSLKDPQEDLRGIQRYMITYKLTEADLIYYIERYQWLVKILKDRIGRTNGNLLRFGILSQYKALFKTNERGIIKYSINKVWETKFSNPSKQFLEHIRQYLTGQTTKLSTAINATHTLEPLPKINNFKNQVLNENGKSPSMHLLPVTFTQKEYTQTMKKIQNLNTLYGKVTSKNILSLNNHLQALESRRVTPVIEKELLKKNIESVLKRLNINLGLPLTAKQYRNAFNKIDEKLNEMENEISLFTKNIDVDGKYNLQYTSEEQNKVKKFIKNVTTNAETLKAKAQAPNSSEAKKVNIYLDMYKLLLKSYQVFYKIKGNVNATKTTKLKNVSNNIIMLNQQKRDANTLLEKLLQGKLNANTLSAQLEKGKTNFKAKTNDITASFVEYITLFKTIQTFLGKDKLTSLSVKDEFGGNLNNINVKTLKITTKNATKHQNMKLSDLNKFPYYLKHIEKGEIRTLTTYYIKDVDTLLSTLKTKLLGKNVINSVNKSKEILAFCIILNHTFKQILSERKNVTNKTLTSLGKNKRNINIQKNRISRNSKALNESQKELTLKLSALNTKKMVINEVKNDFTKLASQLNTKKLGFKTFIIDIISKLREINESFSKPLKQYKLTLESGSYEYTFPENSTVSTRISQFPFINTNNVLYVTEFLKLGPDQINKKSSFTNQEHQTLIQMTWFTIEAINLYISQIIDNIKNEQQKLQTKTNELNKSKGNIESKTKKLNTKKLALNVEKQEYKKVVLGIKTGVSRFLSTIDINEIIKNQDSGDEYEKEFLFDSIGTPKTLSNYTGTFRLTEKKRYGLPLVKYQSHDFILISNIAEDIKELSTFFESINENTPITDVQDRLMGLKIINDIYIRWLDDKIQKLEKEISSRFNIRNKITSTNSISQNSIEKLKSIVNKQGEIIKIYKLYKPNYVQNTVNIPKNMRTVKSVTNTLNKVKKVNSKLRTNRQNIYKYFQSNLQKLQSNIDITELKTKASGFNSMKQILNQKITEIQSKNTILANKNKEIQNIRNELSSKSGIVNQYSGYIQNFQKSNKEQKNAIALKNAEISARNGVIAQHEEQMKELQTRLETNKQRIEAGKEELQRILGLRNNFITSKFNIQNIDFPSIMSKESREQIRDSSNNLIQLDSRFPEFLSMNGLWPPVRKFQENKPSSINNTHAFAILNDVVYVDNNPQPSSIMKPPGQYVEERENMFIEFIPGNPMVFSDGTLVLHNYYWKLSSTIRVTYVTYTDNNGIVSNRIFAFE